MSKSLSTLLEDFTKYYNAALQQIPEVHDKVSKAAPKPGDTTELPVQVAAHAAHDIQHSVDELGKSLADTADSVPGLAKKQLEAFL